MISKNIDKLGFLAGAAGVMKGWADWRGVDFWEQTQFIFDRLISDPHFPNFSHVIQALIGDEELYSEAKIFKPAIKIAIAGEILDQMGFMKKYAKMMKKGGWSAAKAAVVMALLAYSGWAHSSTAMGGRFMATNNTSKFSPAYGKNPYEGL